MMRTYTQYKIGFRVLCLEVIQFSTGYCPHPVTVYSRSPIKGYIYIYIYPYYNHYPTVTEWGQYPRFLHHDLSERVGYPRPKKGCRA